MLNQKDLVRLEALLQLGQLQEFYSQIALAGFQYPKLALGIVIGNSKSGEIALAYMTDVAEEAGIPVSADLGDVVLDGLSIDQVADIYQSPCCLDLRTEINSLGAAA